MKDKQYYSKISLRHGTLHLFANEKVKRSLDRKIYRLADNNLRIPRNQFYSYTPDAHVATGTCVGTTAIWNFEDGFVSPTIVGTDIGCGMRLHLTSLREEDLADLKLRRKLVRAIEKYVPTKEYQASPYRKLSIQELIKKGVYALPEEYLSHSSDLNRSLTHIEHAMLPFDHQVLEHLPTQLWNQALRQIGSIGGGNHFVEIQSVKILEEKRTIAEKWGLFDGQIVVMIHSGSRAWGRGLKSIYIEEMKRAMSLQGMGTPDPKLLYVPIATEEGQRYLNLMYSACNYAIVNRHLIAHGVQKGLREIFGSSIEMPVLYDLMHNYALKEIHDGRPLLVHRKGTTRALPARHPMNREVYLETGHPALIPGSMGTPSYIMVGEDGGKQNYYSICHGAGRKFARDVVQQNVTMDDFAHSLRKGTDQEIVVNHRQLERLIEECPEAYKEVDQIIDSVVGAGLASTVAQCSPLAVIRGR